MEMEAEERSRGSEKGSVLSERPNLSIREKLKPYYSHFVIILVGIIIWGNERFRYHQLMKSAQELIVKVNQQRDEQYQQLSEKLRDSELQRLGLVFYINTLHSNNEATLLKTDSLNKELSKIKNRYMDKDSKALAEELEKRAK